MQPGKSSVRIITVSNISLTGNQWLWTIDLGISLSRRESGTSHQLFRRAKIWYTDGEILLLFFKHTSATYFIALLTNFNRSIRTEFALSRAMKLGKENIITGDLS